MNKTLSSFPVATIVCALLSACGGGESAPSDATVTLVAKTTAVDLVPGQQYADVGGLTIEAKKDGAYTGIGEIEIGGKDLLQSVQSLYLMPVVPAGTVAEGVPTQYLTVSSKGSAVMAFSSPWYVHGKTEYRILLSLKPNVKSGAAIRLSLGEVVNADVGINIVGNGAIGNIAVKDKVGYAVPKVTTNDFGSVTANAGQDVTRKMTVWCNGTSCSYIGVNLTSSDAISSAVATVNGLPVQFDGSCSASGATWYCSYWAPGAIGAGQNMDIVFTSKASSTYNWMSVYNSSVWLNDVQVTPDLPTECSFFITAGSCKG